MCTSKGPFRGKEGSVIYPPAHMLSQRRKARDPISVRKGAVTKRKAGVYFLAARDHS